MLGAPKKIPALDVLLAEVLGECNHRGIDNARQIIIALVAKAVKGDTRSAEILFDRAYGKPGLTIDHGIKGIEKIGVQIIIDSYDAKLGE